ncbi:hypothetical protein Tsubulata_046308 [Turnera subulata]|uniref:DUF4283 domain-containing protein n=1 Tax=Turnera subulata TaxID=218843 RepID=A0A9Q0FYJ0_9ROSI|nr:hypothetical protein Tsubulata_046308 [Turnera subulata]
MESASLLDASGLACEKSSIVLDLGQIQFPNSKPVSAKNAKGKGILSTHPSIVTKSVLGAIHMADSKPLSRDIAPPSVDIVLGMSSADLDPILKPLPPTAASSVPSSSWAKVAAPSPDSSPQLNFMQPIFSGDSNILSIPPELLDIGRKKLIVDINGEPITIDVLYSWKLPHCDLCHGWGHHELACPEKHVTKVWVPKKPDPPHKPLSPLPAKEIIPPSSSSSTILPICSNPTSIPVSSSQVPPQASSSSTSPPICSNSTGNLASSSQVPPDVPISIAHSSTSPPPDPLQISIAACSSYSNSHLSIPPSSITICPPSSPQLANQIQTRAAPAPTQLPGFWICETVLCNWCSKLTRSTTIVAGLACFEEPFWVHLPNQTTRANDIVESFINIILRFGEAEIHPKAILVGIVHVALLEIDLVTLHRCRQIQEMNRCRSLLQLTGTRAV